MAYYSRLCSLLRGSVFVAMLSVFSRISHVQSRMYCEHPSPFWQNSTYQQPIIIGHRGVAGHRPEHTLASYKLAIDFGADFIEMDLVSTKDHVLVARHENDISNTTDVGDHAEFADRRTTKIIDGKEVTGWFTEDFTLKEIKTLRAVERLPAVRPQNTPFDGLYEVPTFEETVLLAKNYSVGLYPETKHPTYFASIGLPLEELLVDILHSNGYVNRDDKVFIQSFEATSLMKIRTLTNLSLIQLMRVDANQPNESEVLGMNSPEGLAEIALYAQGIGPDKRLIINKDVSDNVTTLVADAHELNLVVHPYTFRNENEFLPAAYQLGNVSSSAYRRALGNSPEEYCDFFCVGIDGVFTDNADTAAAVRSKIFNPCKGQIQPSRMTVASRQMSSKNHGKATEFLVLLACLVTSFQRINS